MEDLTKSILEELPHLNQIEAGQRFLSQYYGIVTAVKVSSHGNDRYSIYGYDEESGSPRDCFYPRDLALLGKKITLGDVLLWHSYKDRSKYSHFEVFPFAAFFSIYDSENGYELNWDLKKPYLEDQSEELISWLTTLI